MVKPTDSRSPHRPLRKESEGKEITLKARIITAGHTSSLVQIGDAFQTRIGNSVLRAVSGEDL